MRVQTPAISWHNRERISSVDFQPMSWPSTDTMRVRMASCGDDQHVVIWDMTHMTKEPTTTFDEKSSIGDISQKSANHQKESTAEKDICMQSPKCLADLTKHQNSVNIVRWSSDGKLLASGDTDSAIIVWHYVDRGSDLLPPPPDIFGDIGPSSNSGLTDCVTENWVCFKMLRGHLQDVTSLCFSPSSHALVSCSTDNRMIVYDVKNSKTLSTLEHKGWVNGVIWDPQDRFIISIASDRCMRVFNAKTYRVLSKTIKCSLPSRIFQASSNAPSKSDTLPQQQTFRLFHDDTFKSFYRRPDFSPDSGNLLVVPSGLLENSSPPSTASNSENSRSSSLVIHCTFVFLRSNFTRPVLILPNEEYSICVRFNPNLYKLRDLLNSEDVPTAPLFNLPYRMIYAVATQSSILVYDTQQTQPFVYISKIHYIALNDLSWSEDGQTLVVSSTDGFCSIITFEKGELGTLYNNTEKSKVHIRTIKSKQMSEVHEAEQSGKGKRWQSSSVIDEEDDD